MFELSGLLQVLCAEPLSGFRHYWEVEWSGEFSVGVTYKSISRKGKNSHSLLGYNNRSWSLLCSDSGYSAWHNKTDKEIPSMSKASRIGVYLDYAGNSVSFYAVSENMELIYRFQAKFTEPLYAGFGVGASVLLCSPEKITQLCTWGQSQAETAGLHNKVLLRTFPQRATGSSKLEKLKSFIGQFS